MSEELRAEVGRAAADLVEPDMRIGIGSGRTVAALLFSLKDRISRGLRVEAACASAESARLAQEAGASILPWDDIPPLDLAIDGADRLTPALDCLKGLGGALAREKLIALCSRRFVLIAEEGKLHESLLGAEVPVEVLAFGHCATARRLAAEVGAIAQLRRLDDGQIYRTDNGNVVYDCIPPRDVAPTVLMRAIKAVSGVIETGYFLGLAHEALLAGPNGVRRLVRE